MKKRTNNSRKLICFLSVAICICVAACTDNDKEIRQDIAGTAQTNLNFTGLSYSVANGVVTIWGKCPSMYALSDVNHVLDNIHIIKAIHSNITIAPVTLDENSRLRQRVDSVLSTYPQVTASLDSSGLRLIGKAEKQNKLKLLPELHKVCTLPIDNQILFY